MGNQRQADTVEQRSRPGVDEEGRARRRQNPSNRAPRGFEHQENREPSEYDVCRQRIGRPVDEAIEVDDGPRERDNRRRDKQSVGRLHTGSPPFVPREQEEDEHERNQQEGDAIDLRLDDDENPGERVE